MCYILFIGFYDSISPQFYSAYADEGLAHSDGEELKRQSKCDYYYIQKEPLVRENDD